MKSELTMDRDVSDAAAAEFARVHDDASNPIEIESARDGSQNRVWLGYGGMLVTWDG